MNRNRVNIFVDALALLGLVLLVATGLVMRIQLPPGSGEKWELWNLTRHEWGELHFWIAVFLMGVMLVHLALHWKWILMTVGGKSSEASGTRFALGLLALFFLLALVVLPQLADKQQVPEEERKVHQNLHESRGKKQFKGGQ